MDHSPARGNAASTEVQCVSYRKLGMLALAATFVGLVLWGTQQSNSDAVLAQEGIQSSVQGGGTGRASGISAGAQHSSLRNAQPGLGGEGKKSGGETPPSANKAPAVQQVDPPATGLVRGAVLDFDLGVTRALPVQSKADGPGFVRAPASACGDWGRTSPSNGHTGPSNVPRLFKSNFDMPGTPHPYVKHGERTAFLTQAAAEKGEAAPGADIGALAGNGGVSPTEAAHQKCPKGVQMDDGEIAAMHKWMAEGAAAHGHSHLTSMHMEWGTGGSTLLNGLRAGHIFAVEHHPEWCALISRCFESLGWNHITAVCAAVDLQQHDWCPSSHSNTGLSEGGMGAFHAYVNAPLSVIPLPGQPAPVLDSILVDGRARIACALRAYAFMDMDTALMIHDSNREYYTRHLAPYFNFNKARDCTLPARGICRLYPKKEFVGRVLPEDFIARVADLYNDGTWQPVPPPPVESMPLLSELLAA